MAIATDTPGSTSHDGYGPSPDSTWRRIGWQEHLHWVEVAGRPVNYVEIGSGPPLLLVHGLADDNVVAAHTLRLSSALLAAGRPHDVLPLSGVTHMTSQPVVAENLLLLQLDWIRRALARVRLV